MNTNQRALTTLEKNEYEEALKLFKQAVKESRNIQTLNNLAWFYIHEEEDDHAALPLITEAIDRNPNSPFPYLMLGEIHIRQKRWREAAEILYRSIEIKLSREAYYNLGIAMYQLEDFEEAESNFLLGKGAAVEAEYNHVRCLLKLGKRMEALKQLEAFSEEDENFIGEVEVAELYMELGYFNKAVSWFEKGKGSYFLTPSWVVKYIYSLLQIGDEVGAQSLLKEAIEQKNEEIRDARNEEIEENWTETDKQEHIHELLLDKQVFEGSIERISNGHIPELDEIDMTAASGCYLFGCRQHNHPEYITES